MSDADKPLPVVALASLAVAVLAAVFVTLVLVSNPPKAKERTAAIADLVRREAALRALPGDPARWPRGAVCSALSEAFGAYQGRLARLAEQHGLSNVSVQPVAGSEEQQGALAGVDIAVNATGPYARQLIWLSDLSAEKPTLFVKSMDLRARRDLVDVDLKGTIWCSTAARP